MKAKFQTDVLAKPLILVGTYRKECKSWIQSHFLYPYPVTLPCDKLSFNPKRIGSILLYNRNSKIMKFTVRKVKSVGLSDLWHYDYPVSSSPHSKRYLLFFLDPQEGSKSEICGDFFYDKRVVMSLNDVACNDDDRAILSHWLQNRNVKSAEPYKTRVKTLLPPGVFKFLSAKAPSVKECVFQQALFSEVFEVPFPPPETPKFTFIDLFAGIGGIRLGFQSVGGKCVFSSEWNPAAAKTYESNFGEMPFGDITKIPISTIPDFDILLAGFPCQPFSIIGAKRGFEHETQGTLFFNIEKILLEKQPMAFMLENVRNLTAHDSGKTFQVILKHLKEAGYHVHYKILNALDYGVPQKRERIIICGFKQALKFEFPPPVPANRRPHIREILEPDGEINPKLYVRQAIMDSRLQRLKVPNFPKPYLSHENVAGAITPHHFSCALRAGASANYILVNDERRPSERELLRLQGFPDEFKIVVNYGQVKQQTGNSVAVPVIKAVAEQMIRVLFGEKENEIVRCKEIAG
jgi:DNA (cytosine-5)-methyltransferase 1